MASRSFSFAHLADAHVGAWPRDPAVRNALRESLLRALATVEERGCEFLLVSGDLFYTPVPEPAEVAPVAAALRRLTERGRRVYVIYGSHDYVAHRTSWLDVLAETGIFLKAAPEPVREGGTRWTIPFLIDPPTGAAVAGISGRAHGLDREYFRAMDAEALRQHPGFRIFQFHAAVEEYLPEGLREHIRGISRFDLPAGLDYYAGGHIHATYVGEGPEGGLLVNPGAVFGTSVTDLENAGRGTTRQGLAIVRVQDGTPSVEFVRTAPEGAVAVFDVDVDGKSAEEAREVVVAEITAHSSAGGLLFPRVHGRLRDGRLGALGLEESRAEADRQGVATVHWDLTDTTPAASTDALPAVGEAQLEEETLAALALDASARFPEFADDAGLARLRELLRELGTPKSEGEARTDYEGSRLRTSLKLLGLAPTGEE